MEFSDFVTLDGLKQFPVLVALTWALVQFFFGPLIDWAARKFNGHVGTRYIVYIVAFGLILIPFTQEGWPDLTGWILAALNAAVVALATMKGHELTVGRNNAQERP